MRLADKSLQHEATGSFSCPFQGTRSALGPRLPGH